MRQLLASTIFFFNLFTFNAVAEQVHLLADDKASLQARVDLILNAKEILIEYYSISNDDVSVGFYGLLLEAARNGAQVKILVDAYTSKTPNKMIAALIDIGRESGNQNFQFKVFNQLNILNAYGLTHRTHCKIVLVDGTEMITGGRNIDLDYFGLNPGKNFSDVDIYVTGTAAVKTRSNFFEVWNSAIVDNPQLAHLEPTTIRTSCDASSEPEKCNQGHKNRLQKDLDAEVAEFKTRSAKVLSEGFGLGIKIKDRSKDWLKSSKKYDIDVILDPARNFLSGQNESRGIGQMYLEALSKAEKTLTIVSPYMVLTPHHYTFLKDLLARNIKVKLITNSILSSDNMSAVAGYFHHKNAIIALGAGLELYEYNGPLTMHAKLAILDDQTGVVGTFNMDPRSFNLNREMAVIVRDPDNQGFVSELRTEVENIEKKSMLVGKDGRPQNVDLQNQRQIPEGRLKSVRLSTKLLPLIHDQL